MWITFLFPGKTKEKFAAAGLDYYLKKIQPLAQARQVLVKAASLPAGAGAAEEQGARARETEALLERCQAGEYLLALDLQGRQFSSEELAAHLAALRDGGRRRLTVAVGGAWGLGEALLKRADLRLSLGPMTYPHELARLMIAEQLYRALTIIHHLPYHK